MTGDDPGCSAFLSGVRRRRATAREVATIDGPRRGERHHETGEPAWSDADRHTEAGQQISGWRTSPRARPATRIGAHTTRRD